MPEPWEYEIEFDETGLAWPELSHRLDRIIAGEPPLPSGK